MLSNRLSISVKHKAYNTFNISKAKYTNKSKDVSAQETTPREVVLSKTGMNMYVIGDNSNTIFQYDLTIAFDVSTATYSTKSKDVSAQDTSCSGLAFSQDGIKMYVVGFNTDAAYQYTLSTAWDVSTATYDNINLDVSAENSGPQEVYVSVDGTKVYTIDFTTSTVYQYGLSTPFDLSTGSYSSKSKDVSAQEASCQGLEFSVDGKKMFIIGTANDTAYQYTLSTAWDVSTATYDNINLDVSAQETTPRGVSFSLSGVSMYVVGSANDTVYQYSL